MRDDIPIAQLRKRLEARRHSLEADSETRAGATATVTLDPQRTGRLTRMDALQSQAMAQAGHARAEDELRRITAALGRLDSGDYGYCRDCDEPIGPRRLNADPAAVLCIGCASLREAR